SQRMPFPRCGSTSRGCKKGRRAHSCPQKGANHCPYGYLPANRRLLKGRRRGQQGAFLSLAGDVLFTQTPASFACLDAPLGATAALVSITWPKGTSRFPAGASTGVTSAWAAFRC